MMKVGPSRVKTNYKRIKREKKDRNTISLYYSGVQGQDNRTKRETRQKYNIFVLLRSTGIGQQN